MRAIAAYFLIVFVGAALIAPRFYASGQFLADWNPQFRWMAEQPFHRYLDRCLILLALVGLPVLLKKLQVPSAAALGFRFSGRHCAQAAHGFGWGFSIVAAGAALAVSFGALTLKADTSAGEWSRHLRDATLAAAFVGIIEEVLFRGALFGSLRRQHSFWKAALVSGSIYALLHFFERPPNPRRIEWDSGLTMLGQMMQGLTDLEKLVPAFFNLLLIGVILAFALERTGSLLFSIGLHAGLVFWVKTLSFMTTPVLAPDRSMWGSSKLVDGWGSAVVLAAVYCLLRLGLPRRREEDD